MRYPGNPSIKERISEWLELCDFSLELLEAGNAASDKSRKETGFLQKNFRENQPVKHRTLSCMIT